MIRNQFSLLTTDEIIVDLFAGGGGKSTGAEQALGRHVDIAINHNGDAISMHEANHPQTEHYCADVFEVCPRAATRGRPVGHLHGSPDCTHFSQAIGGQPRSKKIRGLGWVIPRWAGQVRPRSISMENVKQMQQWGPLIAKRCKQTGRVVKLDGSVAAPGERVPVQQQFLIPDPKHIGRTWRRFVRVLQQLGYQVEYRLMNAADYGAATTRERLFLFARRDGLPIVWPEPTHFKQPQKGQKAWRAAAEHIDFSNLGESIFTRKKPLADATLRRIAKGMHKFVLNNPKPFIVELANWSNRNGVHDIEQPLNTITAHPKGGSFAVAAPVLVQAAHGDGKPGRAQRWGDGSKPITGPVNTITASGCGGQALATAYLMQANGGFNQTVGRSLDEPATTITAGGEHHAVASYMLSKDHEAAALRCASFLISYYGTDNVSGADQPMPTATTRDRLALVTVWVAGEPYVIVDICLRMLTPRELYLCQGFPPDYIIDRGHDGRKFTKTAQVRMVGNSVSPGPAKALIEANCMDLAAWSSTELKQRERIAA